MTQCMLLDQCDVHTEASANKLRLRRQDFIKAHMRWFPLTKDPTSAQEPAAPIVRTQSRRCDLPHRQHMHERSDRQLGTDTAPRLEIPASERTTKALQALAAVVRPHKRIDALAPVALQAPPDCEEFTRLDCEQLAWLLVST